MKRVILFILILIPLYLYSQNSSGNDEMDISQQELELYLLITEYRSSQGLPVIPLSKSLTFVAKTHAIDQQENSHLLSEECNLHSWSNSGKWTPCCYTDDHRMSECVWSKPRELTNYEGNGYEISAWFSMDMTAHQALNTWKTSVGHNAMITNKGIWSDEKWQAIGIGIHKNYANVWFGKEFDKDGSYTVESSTESNNTP